MDALTASGSRASSRARSKSPAASPHARSRSATAADRRNYALGIALLLVVVLLWTASNFITQDLFDTGYNKPFLVTYLTTSTFSLYLVSFGIRRLWRRKRGLSDVRYPSNAGAYEPLVSSEEGGAHAHEVPLPPLTTRETAQLAMLFTGPWFLANWSLDAGLMYTSVASATILSGTSGFFTLIAGRIAGVDTFSLAKVGAVLTSFLGVVLVSLSDSSSSSSSPATPSPTLPSTTTEPERRFVLGDILALLSATLYALYAVTLKVRVRSEARVDMQLFFGFVGAFNILCAWPMGVILHFARVEVFELPTTRHAVAGLLINMAITVSSDYIYALAMLKTSPLVVTVGLSLTLPLAVLGDALLGRPVRAQVVLGGALVLAAFAAIGAEDAKRPRDDVVIVIEDEDEEEEGDEDGEERGGTACILQMSRRSSLCRP